MHKKRDCPHFSVIKRTVIRSKRRIHFLGSLSEKLHYPKKFRNDVLQVFTHKNSLESLA